MSLISEGTDLVSRVGSAGGQTIVSADSPLTRLNYFDGKFLRADDLRREQSYLRQLVQFSNQGLGPGVVYGLDTVLHQGRLSIGPGLAFDSTGRALLVGAATPIDLAALIEVSRRISPAAPFKGRANEPTAAGAGFADCVDVTSKPAEGLTTASSFYVICVGHAESLCGTEDVYGRLCEEACVTATDRPLIVEGVVVRALPLTLRTPLAISPGRLDGRHVRSLLASAYFEDERQIVASLISGPGLALDTWCAGAELTAVGCVPLAVISVAGSTLFLDTWTVRRERMEAPSRRYWAWRMAMRPWAVFLAQVLQFQCQLHEVLGDDPSDRGNASPYAAQQQVLNETATYLEVFNQSYVRHIDALTKLSQPPPAFQTRDVMFRLEGGVADLTRLRQRIDGALGAMIAGPQDRVLINGGIVELPSAGYLPVAKGTVSVNEQVRRLLGEGLDLRFCVVRPDFVPHALEEAQHMERISLLAGLDGSQPKPEVDILVPDGELSTTTAPTLSGFDTQLQLPDSVFGGIPRPAASEGNSVLTLPPAPLRLHGAGRADPGRGGGAFHFAGAQEAELHQIMGMVSGLTAFVAAAPAERATFLRDAVRTVVASAPFNRAASVVDHVLSRLTSLTAAARPAETPAESRAIPVVGAAAVSAPKPLVGVWATMRSELDPFALGVADSTPMSIEFTLTATLGAAPLIAAQHVLLRIRASANFSTTSASIDSGAIGRTMTGHLSGTFTLEVFSETTVNTSIGDPFDIDLTLARKGTAASGELRAESGNSAAFQWISEVSWGGDPFEATLNLWLSSQRLSRNSSPVVSASALARSDALAEGGPLRRLSTGALDLIGAEIIRATPNDTTFGDRAGRLLFPPPPPPVDDLTVRPTLDWVLFQRRRTKRCGHSTLQPAPAAARRYQLFTYRAKSQREVDAIRAQTIHPVFQSVDVLQFLGGAATLVSDPLTDWKTWHPVRDTLAYGAVATAVPDDVPLAYARMMRVVQAVSTVSSYDSAQGHLDVLPDVPSAISRSAGTDGIVLLVTLDDAAPVTRTALVIFAPFDGSAHVPGREVPAARITFVNNVPETTALGVFVRSLTPSHPVAVATIAVLVSPVDANADARVGAVVAELQSPNRAAPRYLGSSVLSPQDRKQLIESGHPVEGLDEVIFLEPKPR